MPADIDRVEIHYAGAPTGVELMDDGSQGDFGAGDGMYGFHLPNLGPVPAPVREILEIIARDRQGNESFVWPYLTILGPAPAPDPAQRVHMRLFGGRELLAGAEDPFFMRGITNGHAGAWPSRVGGEVEGNDGESERLFWEADVQPIHTMEGQPSRLPSGTGSGWPWGRGGISAPASPSAVRKDVIVLPEVNSRGPTPPEIKLAGYWDTVITTTHGGELTMLAYVYDADGTDDIKFVELYYQGAGTGEFLWDDGRHNDGGPGDGVYGFTATIPPLEDSLAGRYLFELIAIDHSGNESKIWPYLVME